MTIMSKTAMARDARIFVAGHRGLVGGAIVRRLLAEGFDNLLPVSYTHLTLPTSDLV